MRQVLLRHLSWLLLLAVLAPSAGGAIAVASATRLPSGDEFNVLSWELRSVPNKWLYLGGRLFRGRLSLEEENERLARYLELTRRAAELDGSADGASRSERDRVLDERDAIGNDVEAIIEGRLTAVLEDVGLESSLPLLPDARWVFPPVDVEFDRTPRELAVSPRARIELIEQRPLAPALGLADVQAVEAGVESDGERSALVFALAGAATYPSIVAPRSDYESLVQVVAHEWVHHYLAFKPLGRHFYESLELRTLNETVAEVAGQELGTLVVQRFPLDGESAAAEPAIDLDAFFRALRSEVDALLGAGRVDDAEALMERRRQDLAAQGVYYRRINQAFFAFRNVYASEAGSTDPIGEKVTLLRERNASIGAFLRAAAALTGERGLDGVLAGTD